MILFYKIILSLMLLALVLIIVGFIMDIVSDDDSGDGLTMVAAYITASAGLAMIISQLPKIVAFLLS